MEFLIIKRHVYRKLIQTKVEIVFNHFMNQIKMENRIKVFFVQQVNEDEYETESLWCKADGSNFIIDNIPFVAKRISLGDIIEVEYDDDDEQYYFEDFIENSGNSTVRIYLYNNFLHEYKKLEIG